MHPHTYVCTLKRIYIPPHHANRQTRRKTDSQTDKLTDRTKDRQIDKPTDPERQTDKQKQTYCVCAYVLARLSPVQTTSGRAAGSAPTDTFTESAANRQAYPSTYIRTHIEFIHSDKTTQFSGVLVVEVLDGVRCQVAIRDCYLGADNRMPSPSLPDQKAV